MSQKSRKVDPITGLCKPSQHDFRAVTGRGRYDGVTYQKKVREFWKNREEQVISSYDSRGNPRYKVIQRPQLQVEFTEEFYTTLFCRKCSHTKEVVLIPAGMRQAYNSSRRYR